MNSILMSMEFEINEVFEFERINIYGLHPLLFRSIPSWPRLHRPWVIGRVLIIVMQLSKWYANTISNFNYIS